MKSQCDKYVVIHYILLLTSSIVNSQFLGTNDEVKTEQTIVDSIPLKEPKVLLPDEKICGHYNSDILIGGIQAELDEYPWLALLRYDKPVGWGFYCGGVLISSRHILTAAHCVKHLDLPENWTLSQVRLGEWNTSSQVDCIWDDCANPVQDIPVEQIIVHEGYNSNDENQHNDIALLRLSRNVMFNDFVKPICLPLGTKIQQSTFENEYMAISGWGKSEIRSESEVKLRGWITVVNNNECAKVYDKVNRSIIDSQICAGRSNESCRIDSGGALMGYSPTTYRLMVVGVLSYRPSPCDTPGWPGVYTRVDAYIYWILSKLES